MVVIVLGPCFEGECFTRTPNSTQSLHFSEPEFRGIKLVTSRLDVDKNIILRPK